MSRPQAEAALVAGLSYVGAAAAAAVTAASASTLVHEAFIAAATGSIGGLVGVLGAILVRQIRGNGAGALSWSSGRNGTAARYQ